MNSSMKAKIKMTDSISISIEKIFIIMLCISAAIFHIYYAIAGALVPLRYRALHLMFLLPLAFLLSPLKNEKINKKEG